MLLILIENVKTKEIYHSGFTECDHKSACVLMSKMRVKYTFSSVRAAIAGEI